MTRRSSLGIVQTHATQFDGPLFRMIAQQPDIDLTVYYYKQGKDGTNPYDEEINRQSGWNHDVNSGYWKVYADRGTLGTLRFVHQICRGGHDLVIVSGYMHPATFLTVLMGKWCGIPVGLRCDNILSEFNTRCYKGQLKKFLFPFLFRLYTTGHPVGTLAEQYLIRFGFRSEQLFRFPYAVDNEYLNGLCSKYRQNLASLRRQRTKREAQVVLGIMKFNDREDPITLLKGYKLVANRIEGIELVLVGDGPLHPEIDRFIRANGLLNVHLPGYRPYSELPMYYAVSDVFVHTARIGCWEVSVQEALACGVPVIVAKSVGSGYDLVRNKGTGLLFKAGDEQSLAEAMIEMLQNHRLRERCAASAQKVVQNWSYQASLCQLRAALEFVK